MVFGINQLTDIVNAKATAKPLPSVATQPQGGVHHVQVIVQQGKARIVGSDAVGTIFIHTNRRRLVHILLQLTVQRCKATVKANHQRLALFFSQSQ